ncbi:hypothetical protein HKD37_05G013750 [Glycine soja]
MAFFIPTSSAHAFCSKGCVVCSTHPLCHVLVDIDGRFVFPLCICKGKAAYNIPPPYLRIAKSLWAMGYEVFEGEPWCSGLGKFVVPGTRSRSSSVTHERFFVA